MLNTSTSRALPRSPADWPPDSFRIALSGAIAIGAVLIVLGSALASVVVALAAGGLTLAGLQQRPPQIPADFALWSQYAAYVPVSLYLFAVLRPLSRMSFRELGFRAPTRREILVGVAGAGVMWIGISLSSAIIDAVFHHHDVEPAIELLRQVRTPSQKTSFILMAVAVAPLVEELVFRVFVFNAFRRWTSFWVAAIVSGLLFGSAHAQSASGIVTLGVPLAVGGVVLAAVYERTRCYWSNVLTHALFNSVSVVAFFVFGAKS